ncbi:unnamed protein product [Prunus armeniaca]|uniref:Uncharacterized protein n=1 Tax=Prunus armeniaca TaxID=36596 RepID=A0A6J5UYH9_PRUAR|nr:unnamed protein product [Prunus armeniaca]CAB4310621.1 unnamed protein product [Prunus armeniaca]
MVRIIGAFQFQFVFDGGAARDLHVHVLEDAVPGRPGAENWVRLKYFIEICKPALLLGLSIASQQWSFTRPYTHILDDCYLDSDFHVRHSLLYVFRRPAYSIRVLSVGFRGFFWKAARIGERLSPWVAAGCFTMGISILFF